MLLIYYVISLYNSIMKSTYMCFLKDLNENRPRLALILRLTAIVGVDMIYNSKKFPVRERTFGELANGLCECPVVVLKADQ